MNVSFLGSNLKILRIRKGKTQKQISELLNIKRPNISAYENGIAEPNYHNLILLSKFFNFSIDTLLNIDLSGLSEKEIQKLEKSNLRYITGSNLRILATTIDSDNNENIEIVNIKASAGYKTGYADPEYIKLLPTFQLPFLSKDRKYRTFQISGDSMLPIPDKSWVTGEFVQNWDFIKNKHPYIFITLNDGILFKIAENKIKDDQKLILHSLNTLYNPLEIPINEIVEIWKFVHYISSDVPESNTFIVNEDENELTKVKKKDDKKPLIVKKKWTQGKLFEI